LDLLDLDNVHTSRRSLAYLESKAADTKDQSHIQPVQTVCSISTIRQAQVTNLRNVIVFELCFASQDFFLFKFHGSLLSPSLLKATIAMHVIVIERGLIRLDCVKPCTHKMSIGGGECKTRLRTTSLSYDRPSEGRSLSNFSRVHTLGFLLDFSRLYAAEYSS